jgi:hypothetical protein
MLLKKLTKNELLQCLTVIFWMINCAICPSFHFEDMALHLWDLRFFFNLHAAPYFTTYYKSCPQVSSGSVFIGIFLKNTSGL